MDYRVTLGSDPEFFCSRGGVPIPAEEILPPPGFTDGHNNPFFDGFQAEITTVPSNDLDTAVLNLKDAVKNIVKLKERGVTPYFAPVENIPDERIPFCPPSCFQMGCSPSVNAFTNQVRDSFKIRSLHSKTPGIMLAGGHVHLGLPSGFSLESPPSDLIPFASVFTLQYPDVIRMFESIGVTLLTAVEHSDGKGILYKKRRLFYGLSGEYRHTQYGIEMRSPSCVWLMSPELSKMMYSAAVISFYSVLFGISDHIFDVVSIGNLMNAINHSNIPACLKIHEKTLTVLTEEFGNNGIDLTSQDLSNVKYPNVFDVFRSVLDKVKRKVNFYQHYGPLEEAWSTA